MYKLTAKTQQKDELEESGNRYIHVDEHDVTISSRGLIV